MKKLLLILLVIIPVVVIVSIFSFAHNQSKNRHSANSPIIQRVYAADKPVTTTISDSNGPLEAMVYDKNGKKVEFPVSQKQTANGKTQISVIPSQSFQPGTYTLQVTDGNGTVTKQDFTWGVLAVNTNKSMYAPGEKAHLQFAVLDDNGKMVCNAKVNLRITTPSGKVDTLSTDDESIIVNPECKIKAYVEKPDYEATYQIRQVGHYGMALTATTPSGTYSISDGFEVKNNIPFDIERKAPTRIYPIEKYPVLIDITARQDFTGIVTEQVPASYKVSSDPRSAISFIETADKNTQLKTLSWNVQLHKGQKIRLGYIFDAPDISPEFHLLGPLKMYQNNILVFAEDRKWQIAVDAVTIDSSVHTNANSFTNGSPTVVFTNTSVGYAFYRDSDGRCAYSKTIDGGSTWSFGADVFTDTGCFKSAVWYDRWTPGDTTGTKIYIVDNSGTGSTIFQYTELDTNGDSLGATANLSTVGGTAPSTNGSYSPGITKATDGTVYVSLSAAGRSPVLQCASSCTTAGNWSSAGTSPLDTAADYTILLPLSTTTGTIATNGNVMIIRWDISANTVDSNIYTASGSTWGGWTTIDGSANDNTTYDGSGYGATVNKSTNEVYLAYYSDAVTTLKTAKFSSGSWTSTANICSSCTVPGVKLGRNENDGTIYAVYDEPGTGTVYTKSSSDNMATWGSATSLATSVSSLYGPYANITSTYKIYASYVDNTGHQIYGVEAASFEPQGGTTYWQGVNLEGININ